MFICESQYSVRKKAFKKIKVMFLSYCNNQQSRDFELVPANKTKNQEITKALRPFFGF